ncbi:hypothetical protein C2E23DRAFT_888991 [Lenzites betulinus]|nr:hypothetical protein C2E23DRAFT_888991 [Lenzites betulinus]
MKFSAAVVALSFVALGVQAHSIPSLYAGARRGNQFVTGPCAQDSDCQQGCCAFNTGKCAGPGIAQTRDGGCGFGNAKPNCNVAAALKLSECVAGAVNGNLADPAIQAAAKFTSNLDGIPFTPTTGSSNAAAPAPAPANPAPPASGGKSVAQLAALQANKKTVFEPCTSDADCQQGCCGHTSGKCAGPAVAQTNGSGGCGFGTPTPNCSVSKALGFQICVAGGSAGNINDPLVQQAAAFASNLDGISFTPAR